MMINNEVSLINNFSDNTLLWWQNSKIVIYTTNMMIECNVFIDFECFHVNDLWKKDVRKNEEIFIWFKFPA